MHQIARFKEFVDKMLESNSRNAKVDVLSTYSNDEEIKYILKFVYDPYITTGLSKKKLAKPVLPSLGQFKTTIGLLEYIKENNTGKDEVIAEIKAFELDLNDEYKDLLEKIISKNLQLGIEALTINKVMPKLISTFSIMLANKYFDKPSVVSGKSFALTTKIDGGRIIALKENDVVKFYTRAGQEYEGLIDLEEEMKLMPDNICLDGEITLLESKGLSSKEQYQATMKITRRLGEKHGIKMKVFDIMTAEQFKNRYCPTVYIARRNTLAKLFSLFDFKFFELLPILYQGNDENRIMTELEKQTSQGEEGVMINFLDAPYMFGRGDALLKVKKMNDLDLVIVGFEEGSNSNAGTLGSFIVDYKGYKVKVGSGISKELRDTVWKDRDNFLGVTIIVQYFEETRNQDGGISLRFPVFVDFRFDK